MDLLRRRREEGDLGSAVSRSAKGVCRSYRSRLPFADAFHQNINTHIHATHESLQSLQAHSHMQALRILYSSIGSECIKICRVRIMQLQVSIVSLYTRSLIGSDHLFLPPATPGVSDTVPRQEAGGVFIFTIIA